MTTAADDAAVEDAFEAILAGRAAPEGAAGLAAFTEAVRATATQPGRPSAALADLLVSGHLTDQSSPSPRTARSAGSSPSRGSRSRIRRRFAMILPALLAKVLAGGALAQAATGATVVVVAVTGAGAAGVLPGPVQDRFAVVVEVVTPLEAPTSDDEPTEELPVTGEDVEETPVEEVVAEDGEDEEPVEETPVEEPVEESTELSVEEWAAGPSPDATFGSWVSAASGNEALKAELRELGLTFGDVVSCHARARNDEGDRSTAECAALVVPPAPVGTDGTGPAGDAVDEPAETDVTVQSGPATQDRGGRGNGNGNGGGNGNGEGGGKENGAKGNGGSNGNGGGNGRN